MPQRQDIIRWCNEFLRTAEFHDYAPNGLQVEGREEVRKIVCAVTASQAAIDYAVVQNADMLLVHHGLFWKSEPITITGWKHRRIATLIRHNINMAGYHLPLDAHPELGNNAQLAVRMGWHIEGQTGEQNLLMFGTPEAEADGNALLANLAERLGRQPVSAGDLSRPAISFGAGKWRAVCECRPPCYRTLRHPSAVGTAATGVAAGMLVL